MLSLFLVGAFILRLKSGGYFQTEYFGNTSPYLTIYSVVRVQYKYWKKEGAAFFESSKTA